MKQGTLYTFYSYKGGVGRSMALSNIAMLFYRRGFTVLVIDWDMEAPGIERYFEKRFKLRLDDIVDRSGLCCMIRQYIKNAAKPASAESGELPYPEVENYLYELDREGETQLLLMTAGRRTPGPAWEDYVEFVQSFDWTNFYQNWEGGRYLEWLRERFKALADVVLIDSRTGVTEMGGVATQHLADAVLLFFGANLENISSTAKMAKRFLGDAVTKARGEKALQIMVVPSRIDDADSEGYRTFRDRLEDAFVDVPNIGPSDAYSMIDVLVPYLAVCSYTEGIVIDDPNLERSAHRLAEAYRQIKSYMILMASLDSSLISPTAASAKAENIQVCLVYSRRENDIAEIVQDYLEKNEITVIPIVTDQLNPDRPINEIEIIMGRITCAIILLTNISRESTNPRRFVQMMLQNDKKIIPVVLQKNSEPFYPLSSIKHIDLTTMQHEDLEALRAAVGSISLGTPTKINKNPKERLVYISYSREGIEIADRVARLLNDMKLQVWIDKDVPAGPSLLAKSRELSTWLMS